MLSEHVGSSEFLSATLTARSARDVDPDKPAALAHLAVQARPGRLPSASRSRSSSCQARIEAQRGSTRRRRRERSGGGQAAQGEEGARIRPALGRSAQARALCVVFRQARGRSQLAFLDGYNVQRSQSILTSSASLVAGQTLGHWRQDGIIVGRGCRPAYEASLLRGVRAAKKEETAHLVAHRL